MFMVMGVYSSLSGGHPGASALLDEGRRVLVMVILVSFSSAVTRATEKVDECWFW